MQSGDWASLALLGLLVGGILLGRRNGKAAHASSIAQARAEGRAELQAELSASAVATGGSVAVHLGPEQHNSLSGLTLEELIVAIRAEMDRTPVVPAINYGRPDHDHYVSSGVPGELLPGHSRDVDDSDRWEPVLDSARRRTATRFRRDGVVVAGVRDLRDSGSSDPSASDVAS